MAGAVSDQAAEARLKYVTASVMTASPEKLVVMLYDGALQALRGAAHELGAGRRQPAAAHLRKAMSIVGELRASLDFEQGGELAKSLFALYGFVIDRILKAGGEDGAEPVAEAQSVMSRLREGFEGVARGG
jgi:flagellar protein FliS